MKKILSTILALCMVCAMSVSAFAADVSTPGGSGSTPVNLSSTDDGTPGGDPAATAMSVTVPTALPMAMSQTGDVTTATDCKIVNNSFGAVRVKSVSISTANGWKLTAFGDKSTLAREKVDSNKLGFALSIGGGTAVQTDASNEAITHSKLPSAERFEKWTFDEVLPTIRKHGTYMTDSVLDQVMQKPELVLAMAETLLRERMDNDGMRLELSVTRPKAEYYDAFVHPEDCTNIRATAKELQVPERWFCRFLQKTGFLYRCPAGTLMPYNNPKNAGLFRVKDYIKNGHKGAYTLITPKGKALLRQLIRDCGEQAD